MNAHCADPCVLRFDIFDLDVSSGELRAGGIVIALQPQPFKVLSLLADNPGQVVTREEIRRQLWGNDIFVDFDGGLNFCIRQIRRALGEDARNPRYIGTLPRRGYRFLARVDRITSSGNCTEPGTGISIMRKKTSEIRSVTVAVLPFSELNFSSHTKPLADGITELLITYLSAHGSVHVVSRTSVMRYKHTNKSLSKIARELRTDWVLEGAVLHSGSKIRITARLINTAIDRSEWATCYEAELRDWLTLQDEIAEAVIRGTALHLDLRLQESCLLNCRPLTRSRLEYFQTLQLPSLSFSPKRLDA